MCILRATVSAVSCLVVPAFICTDLLISCVFKLNDDDDDDVIIFILTFHSMFKQRLEFSQVLLAIDCFKQKHVCVQGTTDNQVADEMGKIHTCLSVAVLPVQKIWRWNGTLQPQRTVDKPTS